MVSRLTLAVAGGRKTQAIADHCASLPLDRHAAVLTYTQNNQRELESRIARYAGDHLNIDVMGWFTFLLRHFARPFLPFKFPGKRVLGFNFDGAPGRYATGMNRFLDCCEFSALRIHFVVGVKAPPDCRRNGATRFPALRRHGIGGVMAPPVCRR